jgi:uncharacterized protein
MSAVVQRVPSAGVAQRLASLDWAGIDEALALQGWAVLPALLAPQTCREAAGWYDDDQRFRSRVVMQRHGFGQGEYKYFDHPLPDTVTQLRTGLYPPLSAIANRWHAAMGLPVRFPEAHADFIARCHAAGQQRPTPLLLRYGAGDFNCLHQDLYGEQVFPLQVALLLSRPGEDFIGGEFVLTEQRPRMQSRVDVVPLAQGDAVVFAVNQRPVQGSRGAYRVTMRHGVSRVRSGQRHALGVIFHDAT